MNLGFSEAKLFIGEDSVLKLTPQAKSQAQLMNILGPKICPRIIQTTKDYYIMEKLDQPNLPHLFSPLIIGEIHKILRILHTQPAHSHNNNWKILLRDFLKQWRQHAIIEILDDLYKEDEAPVLIHGDPTLANVMYREKQLLLIDPVTPRGKIPSLREVDYGKMLQSVLGWEAAFLKLPYKLDRLLDPVLQEIPVALHEKAWFWGAVNIIRLFPRAQKRPDIVSWGKARINFCWRNICTL